MSTIWKYQIEVTDEQEISMPEGAQILCVQTQYDIPCLWALVNPENKKHPRKIHVFSTGHAVENASLVYVGSFQLLGGNLVFHVFQDAA